MEKLKHETILEKLETLSGWSLKDNFLCKNFVFKDFSEAFSFLCRVALISETLGHHPDWSGVYNKVNLKLSTHDAGGITALDFSFAEKVEMLLARP